jgi:lipoate-protein ligase A
MFCINLESHDPFFNLALDEVLLKKRKEDFLVLGINAPVVVTGKHQLSHREVNTRFVTENNIPVIRRITGGGTVYHDPGNLNFSMIMQSEHGKQIDFVKYTLPVIKFLAEFGVEAKFEGKNDLKVGGLKISGNAEHVHRDRVLHHGTLLFDSSLDNLRNSLRKEQGNYTSRAVCSNPSSVMNLRDKMHNIKDVFHFRSEMMNWFLHNFPGAEAYELTEVDMREAKTLAESKYKTWEWNYGYGPEYLFANKVQIENKSFECNLSVKDGLILNCKFDGSERLNSVEKSLIGVRHMPEDMVNTLRQNGIAISDEEIFQMF